MQRHAGGPIRSRSQPAIMNPKQSLIGPLPTRSFPTPTAMTRRAPLRLLALALLLPALTGLAAQTAAQPLDARTLDARVFDPATGEPVMLSGLAEPAAEAARPGGGELELRQYLPSGATKLVRVTEQTPFSVGGSFFYQDGASLLSGALITKAGNENPQDALLLPAQPADMAVRDEVGYVALRKGEGLLVADLSDVQDLRRVGSAAGRDLLAIAVAGDYAYAGATPSAVVVYDISDPANPTEVSVQSAPGSANGAWVDDQTLYVATGPDGLRVYSLADPAAPAEIGSFSTGGAFATYVAVRGDVAYLTGNFGLVALDVSDPASPDSLGGFSTGGETTYEIAFDGTTAYLPGLDGLRALDVSDPTNITEEAFFPANQALSVAAFSGFSSTGALLAERFEGLHFLEDQEPGLAQTNLYENAGFSFRLFFDGDLLYVTDLAGRLRIIDTSGEDAEEISRIDVPPNAQEVAVAGGFAYVTDADFGGTGLTVLDVSDPAAPEIVGGYGSPNQVFGLDVVEDGDAMTVYLAHGFSGLVVLDASDPAAVTELSTTPIGSNAVDVTVRDGVAYLVSFGGGMLTFDVSDPAAPVQLDAEPSYGFLNAIDLDENAAFFAYVADGQQGLRVVDIGDPSDVTTLDLSPVQTQARDVAAATGFEIDFLFPSVYVADDFFGIREFAIFPNGAEETGSFESTDRGIGVAAQRFDFEGPATVALAAGETGIYLFEAPFVVANEPDPAADAFALAVPFPNPARGAVTLRYSLPEAADVTLAVFDVLGRRVAVLADGTVPAGAHEASLDVDGLPSGVYLVRLTAGTQHAAQRLVVVR